MNTLQSSYGKHILDVYGYENVTVPKVKKQRLSELTNQVREQAQSLLLLDAWQRRLDGYKTEVESLEQTICSTSGKQRRTAKRQLYWKESDVREAEYNVSYLNNLTRDIKKTVMPVAKQLVRDLELEGIVILERARSMDLEALRRILKTAYWLSKNFPKYD